MTSRLAAIALVMATGCHPRPASLSSVGPQVDLANARSREAAIAKAVQRLGLAVDQVPAHVARLGSAVSCTGSDLTDLAIDALTVQVDCGFRELADGRQPLYRVGDRDLAVAGDVDLHATSSRNERYVLAHDGGGHLVVLRPVGTTKQHRRAYQPGTCNNMPSPASWDHATVPVFVFAHDDARTVRVVDVAYDRTDVDVSCDVEVE